MSRKIVLLLIAVSVTCVCFYAGRSIAFKFGAEELESRAEQSAEVWLSVLITEERQINAWLFEPMPEIQRNIELNRFLKNSDVFHFRLFDINGSLRVEAGGNRGPLETPDVLMKRSDAISHVLTTREAVTIPCTSEKYADLPSYCAKSYLPIVINDTFSGVFEAHQDMRKVVGDIRSTYRVLTYSGGVLALGAMLIPFGFVFFMWQRSRKLAARLDQALKRAEQAEQAKSNFLAQVSHEIRTPLNGVLGLFELLLKSGLNLEQQSLAETISNSSRTLVRVIHDMLDFSKIEAGGLTITQRPVNLRNLVEDVATVFSLNLKDKDVEIFVDTELDDHLCFLADEQRIRQCLSNLLDNAVKYTEAGHISILMKADKSGKLSISVCDTGMGMAEDKLDRIFEAFAQADTGINRKFDGVGLGLSITQELAELMGGGLTVTSIPGQGSKFILTLQLEACECDPAETAFWKHAHGVLSGKNILIAEDSHGYTQPLVRNLKQIGANPVLCTNGSEAVTTADRLSKSGEPADLFLISGGLDDMTADRLFTNLNADTSRPLPPCILLLPSNSDYALRRLQAAGFAGSCHKPIKFLHLAREMCAALGHPMATADKPVEQQVDAPDLSDVHLLLVEDNQTNQLVVQKLLKETGIQITVANNGVEAVDLFETQRPDLVLMDVAMPEMDGHEATRCIRSLEQATGMESTPILALTAYAGDADKQRCLSSGMDSFLSKPVGKRKLVGAIQHLLEQ